MHSFVKVLPTLLIVIDIMAGMVYLLDGDLRRFTYWIAAAVLTATVTY